MTAETLLVSAARPRNRSLGRGLLIGLALLWLTLIVLAPLGVILVEALRKGLGAAVAGLSQPDVWAAARLTLLTTAIATPLNAVFGLAAAWCVTRFDFIGKTLLMALIDLPLSVSPVISGLVPVRASLRHRTVPACAGAGHRRAGVDHHLRPARHRRRPADVGERGIPRCP